MPTVGTSNQKTRLIASNGRRRSMAYTQIPRSAKPTRLRRDRTRFDALSPASSRRSMAALQAIRNRSFSCPTRPAPHGAGISANATATHLPMRIDESGAGFLAVQELLVSAIGVQLPAVDDLRVGLKRVQVRVAEHLLHQ